MQTMSATEVKQAFGAALDIAQREPVFIRSHDRDVAVLLSVEQYKSLKGERVEAFERMADELGAKMRARGLTDEIADEILSEIY
jgi:prevent-host-death family protein